MIPKELAKKIRIIEIYTSKAVNDILAGEYESVFKGRGMEFDEVREYTPGDEVRSIDWNVTARMGHPYIKRFVEERELTIFFLVDLSASGSFGSTEKIKNAVAAELCALLAFAAVKNNDNTGLIIFTDEVELFIPPKKGVSQVLRLIREVLNFTPRSKATNISIGLEYLSRITRRKCVVFLISDFQDQGFEKPLRILAKGHDLKAISITDPRELKLPNVGLLELEDAETSALVLIDTASKKVRSEYEALGKKRREGLRSLFRSIDIDHTEVISGTDYVKVLVRFFRSRERRRGKQL